MGYGLILAGIGKGVSDAGATYGNMMFKAAESELADQRSLQKAMALEKFKEQMKEEAEQRDAAKAVDVDARATKIGEARTARQLDKDVGRLTANAQAQAGDSPAMTTEEMKAHLESLTPEQRNLVAKTGLVDRAMTRNETRLQMAEDQVQAARESGASSTLLKSYQDSKRAVLDAIKEENREKRDDARHDEVMAQQDRLGRQFSAMLPIQQQRADAATTAANRPRGGSGTDPSDRPATTADLQRQITAATNQLATELGVAKNDVNAEVKTLRKRAEAGNPQAKATLQRIQPFLDEMGEANKRMLEFKRSSPGRAANTSASGASDNSTPGRDYANLWN